MTRRFFPVLKRFYKRTGAAVGGLLMPPIPFPTAYPFETGRPVWDAHRGFINRCFWPKADEARRTFELLPVPWTPS